METNGRRLPSVHGAVRHHWVMILVIALCGVGAGGAYAATLDRTFTSSSVVLLNPVPANPLTSEAASGSGAQLNVALETEAEVVASPSVTEGVNERLGRLVPEEEKEFLDVDVPTGTQMVQITFTTDSAGGAQAGAQAFAEVYLAYREERASTDVESSLAALQAEGEEIEGDLRESLSSAADSGGDSFSSRQVDLYVDRLAVVNTQVSTLQATATDPGHVLQPAREPTGSNELAPGVLVGAAGVLALGFGVLLAWYRDWRADLVRAEGEPNVAGVPVFATVTAPPRRRDAIRYERGHEAFRQLRAGVVANAMRPHTMAVGAIGDHGNGSMVAFNLALVLSEAQFSVVLVAADPDDRTIDDLVGLSEHDRGLSDVLLGNSHLPEVLVQHRNVSVLAGGSAPTKARELYAGPGFRQILERLRGRHDFLILAAGPAGSADGDAVNTAADSVLLVLTSGLSTRTQVSAALDRFDRLGARALGAVTVTGRDPGRRTGAIAAEIERVEEDRGSRVSA